MNSYEQLLQYNKQWAEGKVAEDKDYFTSMAKSQSPEFLWIGCSDSRVVANEITGTDPGDLFVHRNIANMVIYTDVNMLSVVEYAVEHLRVKHIIVCGHYGCGGVKAAMSHHDFKQVLNMWLREIKDVYQHNRSELDAIEDENKRLDRLVELNIIEQVDKLAKTSTIQRAWKKRQLPAIHGWVYSLETGLLKPLIKVTHDDNHIDELYAFHDV